MLLLGFLHATSVESQLAPDEQFKTLMGDWGIWDWHNLSKEKLWQIRSIQDSSKRPFRHFMRNIQYLEKVAINTVPKSIHFIWIGPNPFPKKSISNLVSWKKHHPTWNFFFWTDDPKRDPPITGVQKSLISSLGLGPLQRCFKESNNWSEKSDLLRFTIMYKKGGIYVDHDVECLRPLDSLSSHYDFVAGYEPFHPYEYSLNNPFVPNTGLIISRPSHPIMKKIITRLSSRWDMFSKKFPGEDRDSILNRVISRTFDPFAYCVSHFIDSGKYQNILLPVSYFHSSGRLKKKTLKECTKAGHVYAIHRFQGAWLPKK